MQVLFSTIAEILAYATSGILFRKLGAKLSLVILLSLSAVGSILILIVGTDNSGSVVFILLVMVCKFGISGTYNVRMCTMP